MKLAFIATVTEEAQKAERNAGTALFLNNSRQSRCDYCVGGGDGFMLKTLHQCQSLEKPVYGINCGTVGFLMNTYQEGNLLDRLSSANETVLHPLKMVATDESGNRLAAHAINEVSLLRQTAQAAKIRIYVDHATVLIRWYVTGF